LKFEVLYTNGVQHEVELQGHTVVIGRDPACDLVLNDAKCSRRHAIVEMGPSGLGVRDNGSANGVFVNGRKVDRSPLIPGDIIRLGETVLKVLMESTGTVVMDADDVANDYEQTEDLTRPQDLATMPEAEPVPTPPAPSPPAFSRPAPSPPPPPRPAPPSVPPRARTAPPTTPPLARTGLARPMTVTVLAALWLLAGALYGAVGLGFAIFGPGGKQALASGAAGVLAAGISGVMGFGLWARTPWARLLQLAFAGLGVFTCAFTLPSLAIIAYMLRPEIQLHFAGPRILSAEETEKAHTAAPEAAFSVGILGTLLFGVLLLAVSAYVARQWLIRGEVPPGREPGAQSTPAPAATPN
jgi:hypothetical protein